MSKPFDATAKDLLELQPDAWVDYLHLEPRGPVRVISADLSTITTEADKVLRIEHDPPWLLHLELQAGHDLRIPDRLLRYNVLLRYRHELPVATAIILLRPEADASGLSGTLEYTFTDGRQYLSFQYTVVRVWQQPVESVLHGGLATLPFAPLADVSPEAVPAILRQVGERLRDEATPDVSLRIWTATKIMMGLRFTPEFSRHLLEGVRDMGILGIHGIEESSTYQEILAQGRAEGEAKGEARGEARGEAKGRLQEAKEFLLAVGRKLIGPPDAETISAIEKITDREEARALADRLIEAKSWEVVKFPPKDA